MVCFEDTDFKDVILRLERIPKDDPDMAAKYDILKQILFDPSSHPERLSGIHLDEYIISRIAKTCQFKFEKVYLIFRIGDCIFSGKYMVSHSSFNAGLEVAVIVQN